MKHKVEIDEIEVDDEVKQTNKMERKFFAKAFRQSLSKNTAIESVKEFVQLCSEINPTQDCAMEYLESGGNCSELLRIIETFQNKSFVITTPVFQAFTVVLLKMLSSYPEKHALAEEACRELLNKHYSLVKSMLSLNSNAKQRRIALKVLSTMVTVSPELAKEVLVHTEFDTTLLRVLTQSSFVGDDKSVRTSFIHFLISFLIEGTVATKIALLKKTGLLGSIFAGMMYDTFETINLVLTTLQSKIVEDTSVSKTLKMNTFNTQVLESLVSLYNWKGPRFIKSRKSKTTPVIDHEEKELIADCTHRFLLLLCTSNKYGVIFNDPTIGLSGRNYNSLIYTVLQRIKKPWEQKFTSELVINICVACPDLVKYVLSQVEPFLEPRVSTNWTNAVRFVKKLLESLTPNCVSQFLPQLNVKQIATIIEIFSMPKSVLQVISSDTILHEHIGVRHESILLLNIMFESISRYLNTVNEIPLFTKDNQAALKALIKSYLDKYMPPASVILSDWKLCTTQIEKIPDPTISAPSLNEHLTKVLDVLYNYNILCPQLVDNITKELNPHEFLETVRTLSEGDNEQTAALLVRAVNLLLLCDTSMFLPSSGLFEYVLPQLLKLYFLTTNSQQIKIEKCLYEILTVSGIFEGCSEEIFVWLYAILEGETYIDEIGNFLVLVVQKTYNNFLKYLTELSNLKETISDESSYNVKKVIANLDTKNNEVESNEKLPKHTMLSPLIFGIFDTMTENNLVVSQYVTIALVQVLHLQTSPALLNTIILQENYSKLLNKHVIKYYKNWQECENLTSLAKIYNSSTLVVKLSKFLTTDNEHFDINTILDTTENLQWRHYYCILSARLVMFYLTQLSNNKKLTDTQQAKCLNAIIYLLNKCEDNNTLHICLANILKYPVLLELFYTLIDSKRTIEYLCTNFVISIISELLKTKSINELEIYLGSYRNKLVKQLKLLFKKCEKNKKAPKDSKFMDVVRLLNLTHEQSNDVMKSFVKMPTECMISSEKTSSSLLDLLCYILNQNVFDSLEFIPFPYDVISPLTNHLIHLNKLETELNLETLENSLYSYIEKYPHSKAFFSEDVFTSVIHKSTINKSTARLGMILLKHNKKYLDVLETNIDKIIEKRELIFSLLQAILNEDDAILSGILEKVYKAHGNILIKYLNKPQKISNYLIENYKIVQKLLELFFTKENYVAFVSKVHKFDVSEWQHVEILTTVFGKSVTEEGIEQEEQFKYITNYNTTMMNLLTNALKKGEKSEEDWNKIEKIANVFTVWLNNIWYSWNYTDSNLCKSGTFQTFSKLCLKYGLQGNAILVTILNQMCTLVKDHSYLGDLFEMTVSHSETLNILLSDNKIKANVLRLLLTLCKKYPSVMTKTHVPVWLGAYGATLSESDQYLLQLMKYYEDRNVGFQDYRPYVWGDFAVEHYSVRYGVQSALWRQLKPKDILNLFEEDVIRNTITNFPRYRSFQIETRLYTKGDPRVYDPAFYLPLLSCLLVPESTIMWHHCIRRGVIGLAFVALSSEIQTIRAAAFFVMARFHSHLEASRQGKDRLLWLHLVETIARSTANLPHHKLSSIVGVFLAQSALIFTQPDHLLYIALGNYFKAMETHDFTIVPQLLPLLNSVDVNFKTQRNFILAVVRDGLKGEDDIKILFRSVAFKFLLDLHNSVLIDDEGRFLIIQILAAAVRISIGNFILTSNYSILSWLNMVLHQTDTSNTKNISVFIDIISNLVNCTKIKKLSYMKTNVIYFVTRFIDVLKTAKINSCDLVKYLRALCDAHWVNEITTRKNLDDLISICLKVFDCRVCNYYLNFGCEFVGKPICDASETHNQGCYYLKLLTLKWIQANKLECCFKVLSCR